MSEIKSVSVLGCGWFGMKLAESLVSEGYLVKGSSTSESKLDMIQSFGIEPFLVRFDAEAASFNPSFFESDLLLINIPPKRNSDEVNSYPFKIQQIKKAATAGGLTKVIFISSTSVYGDSNSEIDEDTVPHPETRSGRAILEAENLFLTDQQFKTTVIRFAGLVGPGRDPARFFAGKKDIPNGKAPVNLIHLDDCIGITIEVIKKNIAGEIINACSPHHPFKMDFYQDAARKSGYDIPEFKPELEKWKIIRSRKVEPLLNYSFSKPRLI